MFLTLRTTTDVNKVSLSIYPISDELWEGVFSSTKCIRIKSGGGMEGGGENRNRRPKGKRNVANILAGNELAGAF